MDAEQIVTDRLQTSLQTIQSLRDHVAAIGGACNMIVETLEAGGTIYTAGNGGSAAEAMHLAEELIGRYRSNRPPLRAVCLNADPTAITCIANDFGFDAVFARQCEALLRPSDTLVVFSTSGNSKNIANALRAARNRGTKTIGLLGRSGGQCSELSDVPIIISSDDSGHIQEAHQVVLHMLCEAVEHASEHLNKDLNENS